MAILLVHNNMKRYVTEVFKTSLVIAVTHETMNNTITARYAVTIREAYRSLKAPLFTVGPAIIGGSYAVEALVLSNEPSQQKC